MDWYLKWFGEEYLSLYAHRSDEEAAKQVQFVVDTFAPGKPKTVLDIACGRGRHVYEFAKRDICVAGIDMAEAALRIARERIAPFESRAMVARADMRHLPFADDTFDLIVSMFTSFGYFDSDLDHLYLLKEWRRCLKSGSYLFIDYLNAPRVLDTLQPLSERETDTKYIREERAISANGKRVIKDIHITNKDTNDVSTYRESVRLYDKRGMQAILHGASFAIDEVFGDFDGNGHSIDSDRLLIFAKPSAGVRTN